MDSERVTGIIEFKLVMPNGNVSVIVQHAFDGKDVVINHSGNTLHDLRTFLDWLEARDAKDE